MYLRGEGQPVGRCLQWHPEGALGSELDVGNLSHCCEVSLQAEGLDVGENKKLGPVHSLEFLVH